MFDWRKENRWTHFVLRYRVPPHLLLYLYLTCSLISSLTEEAFFSSSNTRLHTTRITTEIKKLRHSWLILSLSVHVSLLFILVFFSLCVNDGWRSTFSTSESHFLSYSSLTNTSRLFLLVCFSFLLLCIFIFEPHFGELFLPWRFDVFLCLFFYLHVLLFTLFHFVWTCSKFQIHAANREQHTSFATFRIEFPSGRSFYDHLHCSSSVVVVMTPVSQSANQLVMVVKHSLLTLSYLF